jgi:type I protein arginine methyltransferase
MPETYEAYAAMLKDAQRIRLWETAIQKIVKPGNVVVEVGTGLGTFALFAAQAGARKVYAIEGERVLEVGQEIAASAGLLDRMEFIEGFSTSVAIPETADVVFYEDFSPIFFDSDMARIVQDARQRFLKPGGIIIPRRASVEVALFEHEQLYRESIDPIGKQGDNLYGFDFSPLRELTLNTVAYHAFSPKRLLAEPGTAYQVDFWQQTPAPFAWRHTYTAQRAGTAHGLAVWFDLELTEGVHVRNGPGSDVTSYQQGILPFEKPIVLAAGESVEVEVRTVVSKFFGDWWTWTIRGPHGKGARPVLLRQTSFRGEPLPESLSRYLRLKP